MGIVKLSTAGILDYQKYSSVLAGNAAFTPSAFDLLESQVLTSSSASVTFTGLDSYTGYKHLQIRATLKTSNTAISNGLLRFYANSDTGANYASHYLFGSGSSVSSGAFTSTASPLLGITTVASDSASIFSSAIIDILDFNNTSKYTTFRALDGRYGDNDSTNIGVALRSALWMNTAGLTSLQLYDGRGFDWVTGCRFSLYGVK